MFIYYQYILYKLDETKGAHEKNDVFFRFIHGFKHFDFWEGVLYSIRQIISSFIMIYDLLPGHTATSDPLYTYMILKGSLVCDSDHPLATLMKTTCLIRYHRSDGAYTSDTSGLPLRFEATHKLSNGENVKVWIKKSVDVHGKTSFTMDPVCGFEAGRIYMNIRRRHHEVSDAGRRMKSLRRKIRQKTFRPSTSAMINQQPSHVCDGTCGPVPAQRSRDDPSSDADAPTGTPITPFTHGLHVVHQAIPPILHAPTVLTSIPSSESDDRKRHPTDCDINPSSQKVSRK